jgi:anthranilate phosphoribosyltransferase
MRHAIGPRRDLAMRTLFNILGPLTNPAGTRRQVIGVFAAQLCQPMAEVLQRLGSEHVMIVHSDDGLDEISIAAETQVAELRDGSISLYRICPGDFGLPQHDLSGLSVSSADESAALIRDIMAGADDERSRKASDLVALNAGAAIYVSGHAPTLADGVRMAEDVTASGQAREKLKQFVDFTRLVSQVDA